MVELTITLQQCQDTDDVCLCTTDIGNQLVMCEQCMINNLVELNIKAPDVRVGSNALISGKHLAALDRISVPC